MCSKPGSGIYQTAAWCLNGPGAVLLCPFSSWPKLETQPLLLSAREKLLVACEFGHPNREACSLPQAQGTVSEQGACWVIGKAALRCTSNFTGVTSTNRARIQLYPTVWTYWEIYVPNVAMRGHFTIACIYFFHVPVLLVEVLMPGNQTETWPRVPAQPPGWSQGGEALTNSKGGWLSSIAINNPGPNSPKAFSVYFLMLYLPFYWQTSFML